MTDGIDLDEIQRIIRTASPEHPADNNRICQLASKSLDNYSKQDRLAAWLCMFGFCRTGLDAFREKSKELLAQYKDYCSFNEISDWHFKRFPGHFPSEEFGLKNNAQMATIHGDVVRTGRLIFFLDPLPLEKIIFDATGGSTDPDRTFKEDQDEYLSHWEQHIRRIERILYVFSILNTGFGYMQGFNEIIFPFYYVVTKGVSFLGNDLDMAECYCFNMFQWLLTNTEIYDFYTTQDHAIIMHHLTDFVRMMKQYVPIVANAVTKLKIHPLLYCLRWFTLLFTQEHELPYLLAIWDSLFAHAKNMMKYAMCIALGQLKQIEHKVDPQDYNETVTVLHNLELKNKIKPLLEFANQCWEKENSPKTGKFSFFNFK